MELHYQRAYGLKDGGSIVVDFTDKNDAAVFVLFSKDNRVSLADNDGGHIAVRSPVNNKLELAALEQELAAHLEKFSSTEHDEGRTKRSKMMTEAETLMLQGNTEEASNLYRNIFRQWEREEEKLGDSDYCYARRALEILQNAQKP